MASTTLEADLFERSRISPSVAAGQSVQFLEHHGFFYQGDARIGTLVDELYSNDRARSDDARLDYFKPTLNQDLRLSQILNHYPIQAIRFRFPWGTTPGAFYNWCPITDPSADTGLIVYMLGSSSKWVCCDGSQKLDSDGELAANGTYRIEDALLEKYPKREVIMDQGGVLFVLPVLAHQAIAGRSIMLGLRKLQVGVLQNS